MSIIAPPPSTLHTHGHTHTSPHAHRQPPQHIYVPDSAATAGPSGTSGTGSLDSPSPTSTHFAASGAATAHAELPPSLAQPSLPVPFPSYTQRHTSPYPMSFSSLGTGSGSALGPITPDHSPPLTAHGLPLHASQPPTAPKVGLNDLPVLSPDLSSSPDSDRDPMSVHVPIQVYDYAQSDVPTPVHVQAMPQAIRPRPSFRVLKPKTSINGKLVPDTMVKLAPPADELFDYAFQQPHLRAPAEVQEAVQVEEAYEDLPRRMAGASLDLDVGSGRGVEGSQAMDLPPPPSVQPLSGQAPQEEEASTAVVGRSRSDGNKRSSNRKSMGPPPRPKRASTAYPGQLPTSASIQAANVDTRQRLRSSMIGLPPRTHTYHSQPSSAHSTISRGIDVSALARPFSIVGTEAHSGQGAVADEAADLGGPEGLEAKVVLLGSQGAGKTSLILRYTTRTFSANSAPATIGSSLHTRKLVHEGTRVKLQIWDTAGQERFRSMAPIYYRGAHVCVLVYDITDRQSFEDVRSWLEELGRTVPKETVIYVVGAKTDLEGQRVVSFEEARRGIRLWTQPPSSPMREEMLPPPPRSLLRSPSVSVGSDRHVSVTPTRSYSHTALASYDHSTRSLPTSAAGTPARHPSTGRDSRPAKSSIKPKRPVLTSPASPRGVHFPALQSPTRTTQGTTTEHVQPIPSSSAASSSVSRHGAAGRYSISGILGMSRTESMSGAALNLARLAEENPTDPMRVHRSASPHTPGVPGVNVNAARPFSVGSRVRTESSPLLHSPPAMSGRRRSEEWSARSWRMGEGPSAAEALGEFGAGVRRRESGELLSRSNGSGGSGTSGNASASLSGYSTGYAAQNQSLGSAAGTASANTYTSGQPHSNVSTPGAAGVAGAPFPYPYPSGGASTPGSIKSGGAGAEAGRGGTSQAGSMGRSRSRGGSLGSASRLNFSETEQEYEEEWGVNVGGIRLGECSALTGDGVEALFKSISSLLVQKKDKIERERTMRKKGSVMLTDDMDGDGSGHAGGAGGRGGKGRGNCCI